MVCILQRVWTVRGDDRVERPNDEEHHSIACWRGQPDGRGGNNWRLRPDDHDPNQEWRDTGVFKDADGLRTISRRTGAARVEDQCRQNPDLRLETLVWTVDIDVHDIIEPRIRFLPSHDARPRMAGSHIRTRVNLDPDL